MVEEDRVAKLPANFEARKERAEYILNEMSEKEAVEADGQFLTFQKTLFVVFFFLFKQNFSKKKLQS